FHWHARLRQPSPRFSSPSRPISAPSQSPRCFSVFFFLIIRPPPRSPLFPYTTLFRSRQTRTQRGAAGSFPMRRPARPFWSGSSRSEEHTSELQSLTNLVCRLLLEKKKEKQSSPSSKKSTLCTTATRHRSQLPKSSRPL